MMSSALACLVLAALAQVGDPAPQDAVAARPATRFDSVVVPIRADRNLDFWYRTAPETGPDFHVVEKVHPFDTIVLIVTLVGIGDTGGGQGHVSMDISTRGATGEVHVLGKDIQAWGGDLPPPFLVMLSQAGVGFGFDDKEPFGTITVLVDLSDEGSGATLHREAELELVPWTYGDTPGSRAEFDRWVNDYHLAPQPGQAVRAFLEYADLRDDKAETWAFATTEFFRTVFRDSPWLVDHLVESAGRCDADQLGKLCTMLQLLGQGARIEELAVGSAESRAKVRASLASLEFPDAYAVPFGPAVLDMLWGEFLGSGRYAPVRRIAGALSLAPFESSIGAYAESKQTEKDRDDAIRGLTFQAARWSLDSNMKQYPLVLQYVRHIAENEELGVHEREQIDLLVEKHRGRAAR